MEKADQTNPILASNRHLIDEEGSVGSPHPRHRTATMMSFVPGDTADDLLESVSTPAYLQSYEGIAKSLAEMNPILSMQAEKLNISVKVMYADKPNEDKSMTTRALLVDVLDATARYDRSHAKKKPKHPTNAPLGPAVDARKGIAELKQRDLRRLENNYNSKEEPYILVRRHAVLLSMGSLVRAVIQADRLLLIVHQDAGNKEMLHQLERHINGWLKVLPQQPLADWAKHSTMASANMEALAQALPFDCRAYEALFSVLLLLLRNDHDHLQDKVEDVLAAIGRSSLLSPALQEAMRNAKDQAQELSTQIAGYVSLLETVLESDEEQYAYMKLHLLAEDPNIYNLPLADGARALDGQGSDLETLLDTLLIDFQALQKLIDSLGTRLMSAEQAVILRLDTSRNELLVATTVLSVIACAIGLGSMITGAFGMNLDNVDSLQPVDGLFTAVCVACLCIVGGLSFSVLYYFHRRGILPSHGYFNRKKYPRRGSMAT